MRKNIKRPNFTQDGLFVKDLEHETLISQQTQIQAPPLKSTILFNHTDKLWYRIFVDSKPLAWQQRCPPRLAEVSFPVQYIKNEMKLNEFIVSDGGGVDGQTGLDGAPHVANMKRSF